MTEARKKIINLISDYMDKTLCEGCLYLYENKIHSTRFQKTLEHNFLLEIKQGRIKIIGHYDITAVLKYININHKNFAYQIVLGTEYESEHFGLLELCYEWQQNINGCNVIDRPVLIKNLPNKPLLLYTEQEEKNLLKLLQSLKK